MRLSNYESAHVLCVYDYMAEYRLVIYYSYVSYSRNRWDTTEFGIDSETLWET